MSRDPIRPRVGRGCLVAAFALALSTEATAPPSHMLVEQLELAKADQMRLLADRFVERTLGDILGSSWR